MWQLSSGTRWLTPPMAGRPLCRLVCSASRPGGTLRAADNSRLGDDPLREFRTTGNLRRWLPRSQGGSMRTSRFSEDQMVKILREADLDTVAAVAKRHAVGREGVTVEFRDRPRRRQNATRKAQDRLSTTNGGQNGFPKLKKNTGPESSNSCRSSFHPISIRTGPTGER